MRRLARFLVVGAALNVTVAWLFVAIDEPPLQPQDRAIAIDRLPSTVQFAALRSWLGTDKSVARWSGLARDIIGFQRVMPSTAGQLRSEEVVCTLAGFPFRSMWATASDVASAEGGAFTTSRSWSVVLRPAKPGLRGRPYTVALPLLPSPIGFAMNTCCYALILWSPGAIRRGWRRLVFKCEVCGYDVLGVTICPECGTAVNGRKVEV